MSIEEQVIQCAANAYMVDASTITPETNIREDLSSKSLMLLAFVSGIENELDATIPLGDTGNLRTIQDFVDKVEALLK